MVFHQIRCPSWTREPGTASGEEAIIQPDDRVTFDPLSGFVAVNHMTLFKGQDGADATFSPPEIALAPREREVLQWAAHGKSAWETAQLLGLSERTVKFYIQRACSKLNAQNKTHAVATALARGLIQL